MEVREFLESLIPRGPIGMARLLDERYRRGGLSAMSVGRDPLVALLLALHEPFTYEVRRAGSIVLLEGEGLYAGHNARLRLSIGRRAMRRAGQGRRAA